MDFELFLRARSIQTEGDGVAQLMIAKNPLVQKWRRRGGILSLLADSFSFLLQLPVESFTWLEDKFKGDARNAEMESDLLIAIAEADAIHFCKGEWECKWDALHPVEQVKIAEKAEKMIEVYHRAISSVNLYHSSLLRKVMAKYPVNVCDEESWDESEEEEDVKEEMLPEEEREMEGFGLDSPPSWPKEEVKEERERIEEEEEEEEESSEYWLNREDSMSPIFSEDAEEKEEEVEKKEE